MQSIDLKPRLIVLVYLKFFCFCCFGALSYICGYANCNVFYIVDSSTYNMKRISEEGNLKSTSIEY